MKIIKQLTRIKSFIWYYKGEADLYRRRMFPDYLLAREASEYPCYVFQSELSKAYNSVSHINLIVDVGEYKEELMDEGDSDESLRLRFQESLVTSSKETIKNVLREVYKKFRTALGAKSEKFALILKVRGYNEYFKGNHQLLAYERVRICLRKKRDLDLILTEIPKDTNKHFPPLFKLPESQNF